MRVLFSFKDKHSDVYCNEIDEKYRDICFGTSTQSKEFRSVLSDRIPGDMRFIAKLTNVAIVSRRKDKEGKRKRQGEGGLFTKTTFKR